MGAGRGAAALSNCEACALIRITGTPTPSPHLAGKVSDNLRFGTKVSCCLSE